MLSLRRGTVVSIERPAAGVRGIERLVVEVDGAERPAYADVAMVGGSLVGDDVVVNTEALDLELGSGGSDVLVVNLTRGLDGRADPSRHVMKLNYTPLQSGVDPVEPEALNAPLGRPVGVFQLHGQLAPVVWAAHQERPGVKIGYVQSGGGALPGALSSTVAELRTRGLLIDHLTAAPAYGGEGEAMSTAGALHAGLTERGWDCAIVGPGPGIIGSGTALGHGGMVALDSAHAALALGCPTVLVARASNGDPRERHQGISHHTRSVLSLLLAPVTVGLGPAAVVPAEMEGHCWMRADPDLAAYGESGLPRRTMGRDMNEDSLFFEQALAGGIALARSVS
ncbi:MAG: DUF3866 family protein [Thermoleophilaceae bacterium]|nr:DUF3866 family protein [Thermoleophilaceae bacterium]